MEDLIDFSLRGVLKFLLGFLRFVTFLAWDCCLDFITWYLGWPVLRILTLGQYPRVNIKESERASFWESILVHLSGGALLFSLAVVVYWLLLLPSTSVQ